VDFENRMININKRIVEEEGGLLVIKVPKTQLTKRDVPKQDTARHSRVFLTDILVDSPLLNKEKSGSNVTLFFATNFRHAI